MRILTESLKRLYEKEKLSKEQIAERVEKGTISADEYEYITEEVYTNENA
ncbi:XkdX family protein [Eisenbergiella sp.]